MRPKQHNAQFRSGPGFTLVEILVSMTVLTLVVISIAQIIINVTAVTGVSKNRLEADNQARLVMDRIGQDLTGVPKQSDVDYHFDKTGTDGNDLLFFFSHVPGYSADDSGSEMSLVGYRVNPNPDSPHYNQLERYGRATAWDGASGVPFLTYAATGGNWAPVSSTTLAANVDLTAAATDPNYHVLAEDVFRFEICYLLSDGSYSTQPLLYQTPTAWTGGTFYVSQAGAPSGASGASTYSAGSRWYDTDAKRGYVCLNATVDNAVWKAAGWQDVAAVVVTIAVVDTADRTVLTAASRQIGTLAALLGKAQDNAQTGTSTPLGNLQSIPHVLPTQNWQAVVNSSAMTSVLPAKAAGAVRVYQRYFKVSFP